MKLEWEIADFHGQNAYRSLCGRYHVFWSDDACLYLADAPKTNSHDGWETAREAKEAMQKYESNGCWHDPSIADLKNVLREVRLAICETATDTVWVSDLETAVDRISAILGDGDWYNEVYLTQKEQTMSEAPERGMCDYAPIYTVTTYTSGNELRGPAVHFGKFDSDRSARQALADAGFTNGQFGWRKGGYTDATIVKSTEYTNHRADEQAFANEKVKALVEALQYYNTSGYEGKEARAALAGMGATDD